MTARDVQIALTLGGVDVLDYAIEEARITWGRGDIFDQADVSTIALVLDVDRAGWAVDALPFDLGSDILVEAIDASGLGAADETVFVGRVSDLDLDHNPDTGHAEVKVTGDDALAQLAHIYLGDEPWPEEGAQLRAIRIAALLPVGLSGFESEFGALPERFWTVRDRDVDRQPALSLMQDVARSTDTALYVVRGESGETPLKWLYHGLSLDHPGRVFELDVGSGLYEIVDASGVEEVALSADYLDGGVNYRKGLGQLVTHAEVEYWDPIGETDVSVLYVNGAAEAAHGTRRENIRTQLVDQADAETLAARTLLRGVPSWRTETLTWDPTDGGPTSSLIGTTTMFRFLRLRDRVGLGVLISDLPAWVPAEVDYVFVEGGVLRYLADDFPHADGHPGRWVVTMALVPSSGIGRGITYAEALSEHPGMTYENVDPAVRYIDALAVGV